MRHLCIWSKSKKHKLTQINTSIGQHTEITGNLKFAGGLYIKGAIKGNVIADNEGRTILSLSEHGTIDGEVNVPYVLLNGVVIGDVHASEHVELSSKARITGNIYYNQIEMASGAEVNGKLIHSSAATDEIPLALVYGSTMAVFE